MKMTKEILHKINISDPINDNELEISIYFYTELVHSLALLGEKYHFAWLDSFHVLKRLNDFKQARKERSMRTI